MRIRSPSICCLAFRLSSEAEVLYCFLSLSRSDLGVRLSEGGSRAEGNNAAIGDFSSHASRKMNRRSGKVLRDL